MKMPSFKDFVDVKNPAMAILYVAFIAIAGLYVDLKLSNNKRDKQQLATIDTLGKKIERLETNVSFLNEQIRRRDSAFAALSTRLEVLKELGKIQ